MLANALMLAMAAFADLPFSDGGGGIDSAEFRDEMTPQMRAQIDEQIQMNIARLQTLGILPPPSLRAPAAGPVLFDWPLQPTAGYTAPDYHGIGAFVDLNPAYPNLLLDYNCGARTYDTASGYNHAGVDIFLSPFPWMLMDQGAVEIVAAAPGTIVGKVDGNDDRSCPNNILVNWNAVYVQHADGTVALYGHMRKFSPTAKAVGQSVAVGEYLGQVGSSGSSTGPHLHFELHSSSQPGYSIIEGNTGMCNNVPSRYLNQRPYFESKINRLATHSAIPNLNAGCPNPGEETPNFKTDFKPGDSIVFAAYYHDQQAGQMTNVRILRPDASVFVSWTQSYNGPPSFYPASYSYRTYTLPANAPPGVWIFEATFQGTVTTKIFTVGDVIFVDGFE
jgi:murein DD-endopeptidase MepM/ murein hydrolase activator NlpD